MTPPTLAEVGTSAAAAIGVAGFHDTLGVGRCQQVVVCLIDGLGASALARHAGFAPHLASIEGERIRAAFPTTTPVGLGALGTGLLAGMHGLVGASFMVPDADTLLNPLHWGSEPTPVAIQPERTVFESVARSGVRMTTLSPSAYRHSGLTRAVLRGADYPGAEDADDRVAALAAILAEGEPSFTYVYWPELDRIGHEFGVGSDEWRQALGRADALVGRMLETLPAGASLIVTADHGMVDCGVLDRIQIEDHPVLLAGVNRIAGEPRARHLYVEHGAAADVEAAWRSELGERAAVLRRSSLVEDGYFGPVDVGISDRIGDVMAIPTGTTMLASSVDATVSRLIGQHGALSDDELWIPALVERRG